MSHAPCRNHPPHRSHELTRLLAPCTEQAASGMQCNNGVRHVCLLSAQTELQEQGSTEREDAHTRDGAARQCVNVPQKTATSLHGLLEGLDVDTWQWQIHAQAREQHQCLPMPHLLACVIADNVAGLFNGSAQSTNPDYPLTATSLK